MHSSYMYDSYPLFCEPNSVVVLSAIARCCLLLPIPIGLVANIATTAAHGSRCTYKGLLYPPCPFFAVFQIRTVLVSGLR